MGVPLAALAVQPPQQPQNVLQQAGQAAQLKDLIQNAPLRQQAEQQQVQAGGLELQQKQQQLKDQQAQTKALQDWDGKDVHDLPGLLLKNGGSAQAVFGMKNQLIQQQKNLADADDATIKNQQAKNDLINGHLEAVKSAPDDQKQQAFDGALTDLEQKGLLKPGQIPHQYPGDDKLDLIEKGFMGQKQIVDNAVKQRETVAREQEAQARVTTANTTSQRLQAEMPGGAMQPVEQKELSDYLTKNPGKGPEDFAKWKASLAPQAQVNVQMGAGGKGGPLSDTVVDALGAPGAKLKLADVIPPRAPIQVKQAAISQVLSKYPQFSSANYDLEKGVMKSAISGDIGKNLTAFNTAIDHAKQAQVAADALDNGDIRALNAAGNKLGYEFGSDKTTNFNVIKSALSGEISKVFKGGQATDAEIKEVQGPFDAANSPAQLKGAIKQAISLMNSKRMALQEQVEKGKQGQANFGNDQTQPATAPHPFFSQFGGAARPQ